MVGRTSHKEASCPVARPLDAVGDAWSLLIVRDAFDGVRRFGEFQRSLGLARNILAARLRNLVEHGILEYAPASDGSAYQEYTLTRKGRALFPVIVALRQWGEEHCFAPGERHVRLVDRQSGRPVRRLELRAEDGRLLSPEDTMVKGLKAGAMPPVITVPSAKTSVGVTDTFSFVPSASIFAMGSAQGFARGSTRLSSSSSQAFVRSGEHHTARERSVAPLCSRSIG